MRITRARARKAGLIIGPALFLSRIEDRNDMISVNALRWVLELIEKLEQES